MSQTPDNLEQTLGEESITATESGVLEGKMDIPAVIENAQGGVAKILVSGRMQEQTEIIPPDSQDIMLTLLRHYPYIDNSAYRTYKTLLDRKIAGESLPEKEIEIAENACDCETDFEKLPTQLQNTITKLLGGGKNTLVIYDPRANEKFDEETGDKIPDSGRIFTTIESLKKKFPSIQFKSFEEMLPGSDKKAWLLDSLADLSKNLSNLLSEIGWSDFIKGMDNVVLLSNRSYAHPFDLANKEKKTSMEESIAYLEKTGFVSYKGKYTYLKGKKKMIFNTYPLSIRNRENKLRAFQKAEEIQSRSLDESIKENKPDAIIPQETLLKDTEGKTEPINIDTIITSKDSYILPAMVGSGKSIWTTELVKKIVTEHPEKSVVFFEGGDWNDKDIDEINKELQEKIKDQNNTILVIDAFDEIDNDIEKKKQIFVLLKEKYNDKGVKMIITGRPSEFHETNNNSFKTLVLKFNIDDFLEKKGIGNRTLKVFLGNKTLKDSISSNPLLAFFVCELANNHKKYSRLGILSLLEIMEEIKLRGISIKPLLYENIIKLMIVKHKGLKPDDGGFDDFFEELFEELSILGMGLTCDKSYAKILEEQGWKKNKQALFFNKINILLKKGDGDNYQFAHRSFQEYFVYRYRGECFGLGKEREEIWYEFLKSQKLSESIKILTNIGLIDLSSFEKDVIHLIDGGGYVELGFILAGLSDVTDGVDLIEEIVNLDTFKNSTNAMRWLCCSVGTKRDRNGGLFLERIVDFDAFKNDSDAVMNFCMSLNKSVSPQEGHILLKKIANLPLLRENIYVLESFCEAITKIKDPQGYYFLKEIISFDIFGCDSRIIGPFCDAIAEIGDVRCYSFLEKIVTMDVFINDTWAIRSFCIAISRIWNSQGYTLMEKIVTMDAFRKNPRTIETFYEVVIEIKDRRLITLLDQIEDITEDNKSLFYKMACAYNSCGRKDIALFYLIQELDYLTQTQPLIILKEKLDLIHLDKNWKNLKDDPEFQMITWKYGVDVLDDLANLPPGFYAKLNL